MMLNLEKDVAQIENSKIRESKFPELCGLQRTYISDIELGKRNVSLENIIKISKALNITPSMIVLL